MSLNGRDSINSIVYNEDDNIRSVDDFIGQNNILRTSCKKTFVEIRINVEDMAISNSMALICALSIPDSMCATTHADFLDRFERETEGLIQKSEIRTIRKLANSKYPIKITPKKIIKKKRRKWKRKKVLQINNVTKTEEGNPDVANVSKSNSSVRQETIIDDGRTPCCSKSLLEQPPVLTMSVHNPVENKCEQVSIKENNRPKPKTKRWMEDEKPVVDIISANELLINGKLVVIDYTNFTKENDIKIQHEVKNEDEYELPLPGFTRACKKEYCRMGCICDSISGSEIVRPRCQNVKCMFGCICFPSSSNCIGGDDGDIRSRLRPRVSLLNWKHSDNTDKDAMANYKQLERGIISLRTKRTSQPPSRLRNEYILDGVRNPLQTIQQTNRRRHLERNGNQHKLTSTKAGRPQVTNFKEKGFKVTDGRSVGRNKRFYSEEVDSSEINSDNNENEAEEPFQDVVPYQVDIKVEEKPTPEVEEVTILYHKIGTAPTINDQFIKSCTNAIKSFASLRKIIKMHPHKEVLARQDGTLIFINWTMSLHGPSAVTNTKYICKDKAIPGDQINLPLLPEGSEWLIYELPKQYEKSSSVSFADINFTMITKAIIYHKINADITNKVVRLRLKHSEKWHTKSSMYLYLLPRIKNITILGPVKKDFIKSGKISVSQSHCNVSHQRKNIFVGSDTSWNRDLQHDQEKMAEPFDVYLNRKKVEDSERLTGTFVPPETMDQMIPELIETYEDHEIPAIVRHALLPSQRNNIILPLKWSDSKKCSSGLHPQVQTQTENAIQLNSVNSSAVEEIWISSDSEGEDVEPSPPEVKSCKPIETQSKTTYYEQDHSTMYDGSTNLLYITPEQFSNFKFENYGDSTKAIYEDEDIVEVLEFDPPQNTIVDPNGYEEMPVDMLQGNEEDMILNQNDHLSRVGDEEDVEDYDGEEDPLSNEEEVETVQYVEVNESDFTVNPTGSADGKFGFGNFFYNMINVHS